MKYLCLIYDVERDWDAMPAAQSDAYLAECMAAGDAILAGGPHVAGEALHPAASASIVRVRNGALSVTDGPFAETRECRWWRTSMNGISPWCGRGSRLTSTWRPIRA